jgi:hypothetical protein
MNPAADVLLVVAAVCAFATWIAVAAGRRRL